MAVIEPVPAVFLDKDGTLVENVPYNVDPARIHLLPGVPEGLRLLKRAGFRLIVVSNQSGVARGKFTVAELLRAVHSLQARLCEYGASLDGFYYCPHHPQGEVRKYAVECMCRKPRPGLIQLATLEHVLDLDSSWMIGDILDEIETARRAGCRSVLLDAGNETEWRLGPGRQPDQVCADFAGAAATIVRLSRRGLRHGRGLSREGTR